MSQELAQLQVTCLYICPVLLHSVASFFTGGNQQHAFEVLAFPKLPAKDLSLSELQVPCIFCDREFPNTQGKNDAVLYHLLVEHQLVIGDVAQVCDMRRYELFQEYLISTTVL